MQDTTVGRALGGRHRLGEPGRIYVTQFVAVVRRSLFKAWFVPGRHRAAAPAYADDYRRAAPRHAHAAA